MSFRNDDDFDKESYVSVNTRLMEFWSKHPEGRVETHYSIIDGRLVMEAKLFRKPDDDKPFSMGHAFLDNLDGEKVGEYTETVSVGRALALAGFQVEKSIASSEEMAKFQDRKSSKAEADARGSREVSDSPEVPKSLRPARVFKPLNKSKNNEE
jgi:hypothetical protein